MDVASSICRNRGPATAFPRAFAVSVSLLLLSISAYATSPKIANITPTGAQRGSEVELRLAGSRLDDAQELIFYETGIEVQKVEPGKTNTVHAQLKVAADCSLGEHHFRLRTSGGISELKTFQVGPFPVVTEIEPNNA